MVAAIDDRDRISQLRQPVSDCSRLTRVNMNFTINHTDIPGRKSLFQTIYNLHFCTFDINFHDIWGCEALTLNKVIPASCLNHNRLSDDITILLPYIETGDAVTLTLGVDNQKFCLTVLIRESDLVNIYVGAVEFDIRLQSFYIPRMRFETHDGMFCVLCGQNRMSTDVRTHIENHIIWLYIIYETFDYLIFRIEYHVPEFRIPDYIKRGIRIINRFAHSETRKRGNEFNPYTTKVQI